MKNDSVFQRYLYALVLMLAMVLTACKTPQSIPHASFNRPPFISPKIIQDLSCWMSDQGDAVVAINLEAQNSNRYYGEPRIKQVDGQNPLVCHEEITAQDGETNITAFGYQYVGRTDSGIEVLATSCSGGGSGVFRSLLLLKSEQDHGITCDWDKGVVEAGENRLVIKKLGEIALGDRWEGELAVKGNSILVGKDRGVFAGSDKGGSLSAVSKDRSVKIKSAGQ